MLERARAKATARRDARHARASSGATRSRCRTRTTPSTRRRSASAPATSTTSPPGLRGDGARRAARGAGRRARDHDPDASAAVALLPRLVRPHGAGARAPRGRRRPRCCRARGGRAGGRAIADAYTYLPNSVKRFPAPGGARRRDGARRALARSATVLHGRAASSRSMRARFARGARVTTHAGQQSRRRPARKASTGSRRSCATAASGCAS